MTLITKIQAAEIIGVTQLRMNTLVHSYRHLGWPGCQRKVRNVQYYHQHELLAWYDRVKAERAKEKDIGRCRDANHFDNAMARQFICAR
jgi:hypothetical protein